MKLSFLLLVAAFALLTGCAGRDHYSRSNPTIFLDPSLSDEEMADITAAVSEWEMASTAFRPHLVVGTGQGISFYPSHTCPHAGWKPAEDAAYTWDDDSSATVCLDPVQLPSGRPFINGAAHELGHALGLVHKPAPSIMQVTADRTGVWQIQADDVSEVNW